MDENPKQQVQEWLAEVKVGQGMHYRNLTIFPLSRPGNGEARYQLLSEAVEANEARVEEIDEAGEVPFLGVTNQGGTPILIPEGEILIGAKQNRVVNLTVLVAAKTTFKLPVSCVERGRWHYRSREFKPAAFAHPKLRDLKVRTAQYSRRTLGLAVADQGAVWDEVDEHLEDMDVPAPTRDLVESYDAPDIGLAQYRDKIELPEGACGFVAAHGGKVVGLDLFDKPNTLHKLWDRMADAYFIEAARRPGEEAEAPQSTAAQFVQEVAEHLEEASEQPQLGLELEITDDRLSGSALFYDGAVCHLSAFSSQ